MQNSVNDSTPLVMSDSPSASGKPALLMIAVNALYSIKYKSLIFLFILFILITSDVFVSMLLKKLNGAVDDRGDATPYGTVMQGLTLVLAYMVLNFCIDQEII